MKKTLVPIAIGLCWFLGCGEKIDSVDPTETGDAGADAGVGAAYSTTIMPVKPMLDAYCVPCHSSRGPTAGVAFDTYENAVKNGERGNVELQSGRMPPSGSKPSDAEKELFQVWVETGFPK